MKDPYSIEQEKPTPRERTDPDKAAFDRIYERYGADLAAFFRDARLEVTARRQSLQKCLVEDVGQRS